MHRTSLIAAAVVVAGALPVAAEATTFCVNGPADCSGTAVTAADLETSALQGAHRDDGQSDVVVIGAGTYTDAETLAVWGNDDMDIRGAGMGQTVLTSSASANVFAVNLEQADGRVTMRDLTIAVPASFPDAGGYGAALQTGGDLLERVQITSANKRSAGIIASGPATLRDVTAVLPGGTVVRTNDAGLVVEESDLTGRTVVANANPGDSFTIRRSTLRAADFGDGVSAVVNAGGTATVEDTIITVAKPAAQSGFGVITQATSNFDATTLVDHTTIVQAATEPLSYAFDTSANNNQGGDAKVTVTNSIVSGFAFAGIRAAGSDPADGHADVVVSHSNSKPQQAGSGNGGVTQSVGMIDADPLFTAPGGDYRLQSGSPSVDAGDPAFPVGGIDFDGAGRVLDGDLDGTAVTDQGAFERLGPPPSAKPQPQPEPSAPTSAPSAPTSAPSAPTSAPSAGAPRTTVTPLARRIAGTIRRSGKARVVRSRGKLELRTGQVATCTPGGPACAVTLVATAGRTTIGRTTVAVTAGRAAALRLRVTKAGAKRLRRSRKSLKIAVAVTIRQAGAADAAAKPLLKVR